MAHAWADSNEICETLSRRNEAVRVFPFIVRRIVHFCAH